MYGSFEEHLAERKRKKAVKKAVRQFCDNNEDLVEEISGRALHLNTSSDESDFVFEKFFDDALKEAGFVDLPFTAKEFLKYW